VEHAARRIEEFWECRPTGQHCGQRPLAVEGHAGKPMSKAAVYAQAPADWRSKAWLRVDEVAEILRYSRRYVYTLVKDGKLDQAEMTGGGRSAVRISRKSVAKMLVNKRPRTE
jgi:excisionase family DNA binding protein